MKYTKNIFPQFIQAAQAANLLSRIFHHIVQANRCLVISFILPKKTIKFCMDPNTAAIKPPCSKLSDPHVDVINEISPVICSHLHQTTPDFSFGHQKLIFHYVITAIRALNTPSPLPSQPSMLFYSIFENQYSTTKPTNLSLLFPLSTGPFSFFAISEPWSPLRILLPRSPL